MKILLLPCISIVLLLFSFQANATLVSCNGCTNVQMKTSAEQVAERMPAGVHQIKVLNITNADYHLYQISVVKTGNPKDPNAAVQIYTQRLTPNNEVQIKNQIASLRSAISDINTILSGKVLLPDRTAYNSAADALRYKNDFGLYLQDFLNREHSGIQAAIFETQAIVLTLASNIQVTVGQVVSATTSLTSGVVAYVVFPDGSSMSFKFTFNTTTSSDLEFAVDLTQNPGAYDGAGVRIPRNVLEAKYYVATKDNINIESLSNYFKTIGIRIVEEVRIVDDQGGSSMCDIEVVCSDGKVCYRYRTRCN